MSAETLAFIRIHEALFKSRTSYIAGGFSKVTKMGLPFSKTKLKSSSSSRIALAKFTVSWKIKCSKSPKISAYTEPLVLLLAKKDPISSSVKHIFFPLKSRH